MASVVINTRFNNRKAEADVKELQAKAKETAREINAVEKGLGSATTKRNKLRDDLEAARQKAAETAAALDEVNARLDAGRKSKFGVTSKGDETLSDKLAAKLQQQDTAVQAAADAYHAQDAAVQALQQRHAELTAQLAQEKDEATRQAEAVANAAQAAQAAQVDVSNVQRAANAMDAFVSKLFNAASVSKILKRSLSAIGSIGGKAFDFVKSKAQSVQERLAQAAQSTEHFRKRLAGLVSGALVFNVLSSGLRTLTNWMGTALLSSSSLRTALGNLQGAAATAAAPIIQILTPALTALANAAAMVFSYIARLVAFFTGRTISASAGAAKAMNGVGSAAGSAAKKVKDANGELAAFDELNVLNKQSDDSSGGGGGGADSITPDFDFSAENPFLDSIIDAIEQGDWYKVGQLIGEKLRDSLNAIPWPDIQDKAVQWATNIADCINGFIEVPGLWTAIGHTIAQGLNTALLFADTLMQRIHWDSLGAGIAEGLTTAVTELRWDTLGRVLTDGMRAAILTLYNFVLHYSGWTDLGNGIATCINSAISNIPWLEAGLGAGGFAIGLLNALIAAVQGTNWNDLGHNIVTMIAAIDWPGLFSALSTLALDVLQAINTILGQVDWDAVGSKIMECLQAVDWVGILAQVAELISNCWPLLMAALAVSLLPVIGAFILDTVLPAILSGLGSLIVTVISAIGAWPVLLLAVLASIAAVIINYLVTHWDEIKQNFSQTLADLAQALNTAGENLQHIWDTLWLTIKLLGLQIWESITTGWSNFWKGIDLALRMAGAALQAAWSACWLIIKLAAMQIWEDVTTAWSNFWKGLSLLLSMAGAALNAVWTAAWSALADTVSSIWDGITSVVRGAVNGIIRIINGMISAIVGGMNAVIGLLNGFSFDVPEFAQDALGTAKVGFNIDPITAPQIPYLAQGAVIPANHEFLAVLGDQTNGTNVEAPLETIQQALAEVLAEWGGQDITIRFAASGGLEQLVRLLMPYIDKEKARRGARLVVGGN